jgi:Fe-S-cluster containining protein
MADFVAYVTDEDIKRWQQEEREDILRIIDHEHAFWAGDHLLSSEGGRYLRGCPLLVWEGDHCACSIYDTRPQVCVDFIPGSSELCPQFENLK